MTEQREAAGLAGGLGRRIVVVGSSCSGKSTLGARLAEMLEVPFVELDALYWKPNWTPAEDDEFTRRVIEATSGDGWVVAGAYHRQTEPTVWPRAESVVWLDLSRPTLVWRIFRRLWRRWRNGEVLWGTNRERFWEQFRLWSERDSLVGYTLRNHGKKRRRYLAVMDDPAYGHIRFVRLRSQREIDAWWDSLEAEAAVDAARPRAEA